MKPFKDYSHIRGYLSFNVTELIEWNRTFLTISFNIVGKIRHVIAPNVSKNIYDPKISWP